MGGTATPDAPVFVIGAPRSGTTLLYKALCLHAEAAWISNWTRRTPRLPQLAALNRIARRTPGWRQRVWFGGEGGNAYVYGRRRGAAERLYPMPAEGEPVFTSHGLETLAPTPPGQVDPVGLRRSFAALARWSGAPVVVSKRIAHNLRIDVLADVFPEARFVVVHRDGRAVARSLGRVDWWADGELWWLGATPAEAEAAGRDPVELCALHWVREVDVIDAAVDTLEPARVLRLRYEDVVASPRPTLAAVGGFAGLGPSAAWDRALDGVSFPDRNEGWRTGLDQAERQVIEAVQTPTLRRLGYRV